MLRVTVTILWALVLLIALAFNTSIGQMNDSYKALNTILKRETGSGDIQANLEVAKQQLTLLNVNYESHWPGNNDEKQLIETIEEFIDAIELSTKDTLNCGQTEHATLAPLATNTRGLQYYTESEAQDLDRLDSIAHQLLYNYAKQCMPQYPDKFETKINELDAEDRKTVDDFMRDLLICDPSLSPKECMKWLVIRDPLDVENDAEYISGHIKEVSSNDPESGSVLYMYYRYFFEPCQNYVWTLGPDLFEPAMFVANVYENLEAAYDNLESEKLPDYFKSMASYNFCNAAIHDHQFETYVRNSLKGGRA